MLMSKKTCWALLLSLLATGRRIPRTDYASLHLSLCLYRKERSGGRKVTRLGSSRSLGRFPGSESSFGYR